MSIKITKRSIPLLYQIKNELSKFTRIQRRTEISLGGFDLYSKIILTELENLLGLTICEQNINNLKQVKWGFTNEYREYLGHSM